MLKQLYELALMEGEGLGTAYEYASKREIIKKYLNSKKVLIYGLPEKYGFSLDFLYFSENSGCEVHVYEKKKEKLKRYCTIIRTLEKKGIIKRKPLIISKIREVYDVIFSSEVIQQLNSKELQEYCKNVTKFSKSAVVFFPNQNNTSHHAITGLKAYTPEEVSRIFGCDNVRTGFVDMPPFPPGLHIKSDKTRRSLKVLAQFLHLPLLIEKISPRFIKKRFCHIAYIAVWPKNSSQVKQSANLCLFP